MVLYPSWKLFVKMKKSPRATEGTQIYTCTFVHPVLITSELWSSFIINYSVIFCRCMNNIRPLFTYKRVLFIHCRFLCAINKRRNINSAITWSVLNRMSKDILYHESSVIIIHTALKFLVVSFDLIFCYLVDLLILHWMLSQNIAGEWEWWHRLRTH